MSKPAVKDKLALVKGKKDAGKGGDSRSQKIATGRRLAWTGVTQDEMKRPGIVLIAWLTQEANERGLQMQELASELGVTYGYIAQLRNGHREIRHISDEFTDACARFLRVPRMAVMLAAGRVRPDDFYEAPESLAGLLDNALHFIQKDPDWGPFLPPEIFASTMAIKQFAVMAYEEATGRNLVPTRLELGSMIESVKEMEASLR